MLTAILRSRKEISLEATSNFDLETVLSSPPKIHELRGELISDWRIDNLTCSELNARLKPRLKTLETGAGLSTIIFAGHGCQHTCITPGRDQVDRIQDYCRSRQIDTSAVSFLVAKSSDVIHQSPRSEFDLILIDGCHGFPSIFVDFYYAAKLLKVGGTLIIDDMHIYTCQLAARFMQADPGWKVEKKTSRVALGVKLSDRIDEEWTNQPFVVQRSSRQWLTKSVRFCLNASRPLRSRVGLTGNQLLGRQRRQQQSKA